ncbi:MAG: sugar phosphate isomerase/epimerase [Bacteroidales bacterium]|nr:sugar phosphate isomerase/epimerase [Bacteroidales bacterium]MCM1414529.1 sugar phosphate isomerase/epimerase [bacterium]MCM1422579.1 sugar phosphate isomerase/epimerase [bacterium]
MNQIGFMQGRLTDKGGFYPQKFPAQNWKQEFAAAAKIGFDCIEWMFNDEEWRNNPLMLDEEIDALNRLSDETGVSISAVCVNYFMQHCIYSTDPDERKLTEEILEKLMESAKRIKCSTIVIPMFEASELLDANGTEVKEIKQFLDESEGDQIQILIESNMEAKLLKEYIGRYESDAIGVCLDLGNLAGLGRDLRAEIEELGSLIKDVHIKDKKIAGTTVMLGKGDVDFERCLHQLSEIKYEGTYILESYYGNEAVCDTERNYKFLKGVLGR